MIERLCFAVLIVVLTGWIYHLTYRQQQLIELSERILVDLGVELPPSPLQRLAATVRCAAYWVNERLRPVPVVPVPEQPSPPPPVVVEPEPEPEVVVELEPATEPIPVVRPSPVPRDLPATSPMGRAWEESAAELADDDWRGRFEAEMAAARARVDELARGAS